jgi:large subunit ribosomal protein L11
MAKKTIDALVEAGKATAGPPLGPALGPMGVNIGQVISEINKKTAEFKGMQVPVKVIVDESSKAFEIKVGTPPTSSLIMKETGLEKGSKNPKDEKVADIMIEQIIKISKMKEDSLFGKTLKDKVKEVIGTCNSMGVLVEGVPAKEAISLVNEGKFDAEIKAEKTELTEEEKKKVFEERDRLARELQEKKAAFEKLAKDIITAMEGKEKKEIRLKLKEAKIPAEIIDELVPLEEVKVAEAKPTSAAASKVQTKAPAK